MLKKSTVGILALILATTLLFAFQNCSVGKTNELPIDQSSTGAPNPTPFPTPSPTPQTIPTVSMSAVTMTPGQTVVVPLTFTNIDKNYTLNWRVDPTTSDFSPASGTFTVTTGATGASVTLKNVAVEGSGNKIFSLIVNQTLDATAQFTTTGTVTVTDQQKQIVAVGYQQSFGFVNNELRGWGYNGYGTLGTGNTNSANRPVNVNGLPSGYVSQVASGNYTSCAIVAGAVYCWGAGGYGQLGDGTTGNRSTPGPVAGMDANVTQISVGWAHACAIKSGGLYCWGENSNGNLGVNDSVNRTAPTPVGSMFSGVTAVVAGYYSTCAIKNGEVYCWGYNQYGQLGEGTYQNRSNPTKVVGAGTEVTAITLGSYHGCAIAGGKVRCWGNNNRGQLGDGTATSRNAGALVTGIASGATQIVAGQAHTCALVNGAVKCWGFGGYYNLGNNSQADQTSPVAVTNMNSGVTALSGTVESQHTCAIQNQKITCWGRGDNGEIGDGTNNNKPTPDSML